MHNRKFQLVLVCFLLTCCSESLSQVIMNQEPVYSIQPTPTGYSQIPPVHSCNQPDPSGAIVFGPTVVSPPPRLQMYPQGSTVFVQPAAPLYSSPEVAKVTRDEIYVEFKNDTKMPIVIRAFLADKNTTGYHHAFAVDESDGRRLFSGTRVIGIWAGDKTESKVLKLKGTPPDPQAKFIQAERYTITIQDGKLKLGPPMQFMKDN